MQKKIRPFVFLASTVIFAVFLAVITSVFEGPRDWVALSGLDLVNVNSDQNDLGQGKWYANLGEGSRSIQEIAAVANEVRLHTKEKDGVYTIFNPFQSEKSVLIPHEELYINHTRLRYTESSQAIEVFQSVAVPELASISSTVPDPVLRASYERIPRWAYLRTTSGFLPVRAITAATRVDLVNFEPGSFIYYKKTRDNVIQQKQNPSFDAGLWRDAVLDCTDSLPGDPVISQSLEKRVDGEGSLLRLFSENHSACTNKRFVIQVMQDCMYELAIQYKTNETARAKIYYEYISGSNEDNSDRSKLVTLPNNQEWSSAQISLPGNKRGFIDLSVFLYSFGETGYPSEVMFDDLAVKEFCRAGDAFAVLASSLEPRGTYTLHVPAGSSQYMGSKTSEDGELHTKIPMDREHWGGVEDCTKSAPGEADIAVTYESVTGSAPLALLSAKNHSACIHAKAGVNFDDNFMYLFSIQAKNTTKGRGQFYVQIEGERSVVVEDGDEKLQRKEVYTSLESISGEKNEWLQYDKVIQSVPKGAKNLSVFLYSPAEGGVETKNEYKEVSIKPFISTRLFSKPLTIYKDDRNVLEEIGVHLHTMLGVDFGTVEFSSTSKILISNATGLHRLVFLQTNSRSGFLGRISINNGLDGWLLDGYGEGAVMLIISFTAVHVGLLLLLAFILAYRCLRVQNKSAAKK